MITRVLEEDGPMRLTWFSHRDEHEGHGWHVVERVFDNPAEYVVWGRCMTCAKPEGLPFIVEATSLEYA